MKCIKGCDILKACTNSRKIVTNNFRNNNYNQAQNFIDQLNHYLYRIGLTFDDLKEASRKGKLEVEAYSFSNNLKTEKNGKEKVKDRRLSGNEPKSKFLNSYKLRKL